MRAESSAGRYNRNVLVFENMDEILSQRSQESFAESEDRSMTIPRRLSNNNQRTLSARSSISWSRQQGGSQLVSSIDPDEFSGTAGLMVNKPLRFTRRHSSTNLLSTSRSSSSSSISDGELIDRRLTKLSSGTIHVPSRPRPTASFEVDSEDEFIAGDRRSRFLACLGCFNSRGDRDASGFRRMSPQRNVKNHEKKSITSNPLCKSVERILNLLSERTEIDVLDAVDQRVVFLLYAALSGEPLLNPSEYADCDEWLDWLVLGFSSHSLDAFERDINRHGSQAMGLLFHVFFSIEFTQLAQICCVIIRNIHLDPASLYGLFAVNCSKWTRDVILGALRRFEERPHQHDDDNDEGVPLLFQKGQDEEKFKSFMTVMDAWISCGAWGSMEAVENRFSDVPRRFGKYKSFLPPEEEDAADAISSDGPAELSCCSADDRKCPARRIERVDDLAVLRRTVLVGSIYYTYTMLSFAKFWLQKDLISVDSEAARERLNNAYLDREFVSKLKLSASMPLAELLRSIDKLSARVLSLWKSSGWRKEDLLGTHVDERNSAL